MKLMKAVVLFTPLVAGVSFVAWSMISARFERQAIEATSQAIEATAHAAGFSEFLEMAAAQKLGISDPAAYRARVEVDQAKIAADNVIRDKNMKAAEAEGAAVLRERNRNPAAKLAVKSMTWGRRGVAIVNVAIENGNDFAVKDIAINCRFSGKSGTELSTNDYKIFDIIPAKAAKTFKELNVGLIDDQSARAHCYIVSAQRP
jgi:hypothetical protein